MNLLRNQEPSGGIVFGEVGFIMALWKYGIVALCHYGIVRCQFHNGSFSQMNQLQNLSCFRHWEFRSLGDLESLDDSKTPKLQAAKAIIAMRGLSPFVSVDRIARINLRLRASPKWLFLLQRATGRTGIMPVALGHHEARDRESERLGRAVAHDGVLERHVLVRAGRDLLFRRRRQRRGRTVRLEDAPEDGVLGADMECRAVVLPFAVGRPDVEQPLAGQRPFVSEREVRRAVAVLEGRDLALAVARLRDGLGLGVGHA